MHKSERLFQLVNLLKGRRLAITAKQLADKLCVSERTIYRDIQHLQGQGVPIEGEAGIGYLITEYDLPPMMFTPAQLKALLLGSRMVSAWTDPALAADAQAAIAKIEAVLPSQLKQQVDDLPYLVSGWSHTQAHQAFNQRLRHGIEQKKQMWLDYEDAKKAITKRHIEPLGLVYWGGKWTLIAHCLLRNDYREFRLDRIIDVTCNETHFTLSNNKSLEHYLSIIKAKYQDSDCE